MVINVANPATFVLTGGFYVTGTRHKQAGRRSLPHNRERTHPGHAKKVVDMMAQAQRQGPLPPPKPPASRLNVYAFFDAMTADGTKVLD